MVEIDNRFYNDENNYNKDEYEGYIEDIKKYIESYKKEEYFKIIEKDKRTNIVNIFSELRANIIKWYTFKENSKILEIGANFGEISQELSSKAKELTIVEFSKEKAECIQKRLQDIVNTKIILCSNLKETKIEEKYDYITLIGIAEYAKQIGFKNLEELLNWALEHLSEEGKILFAINNKFGVKNLAGSTKYKEEVPFAVFKNYINKNYKVYGKTEIEKILNKDHEINYKFFYPVPNYNITHAIYTDEYLPRKGNYNIYYREDEEILFNELSFIDETIKNNKFDFFTNSYLIEIAKKDNSLSNILFVNYTNIRKKEYKIITKLAKDRVTKESYYPEEIEHINRVQKNIELLKELGFTTCEKYEQEKIVSNFINYPTMDEYLSSLLKQNKIEEFYEQLYKWEKYLKTKLETSTANKETIFEKYNIEIEQSKKQRLTFIKNGFIDLMFQNVFYGENEEYIIFDQEWYEENIPIEFIMYRSIKQLVTKYNFVEDKIDKEDLYKKYGIYPYIEEFDKLEEKWQETITDKSMMDFYSEKWSRIISIEDIKHKYNQELGKIYNIKDEFERKASEFQNQNNMLKIEVENLRKQNQGMNKKLHDIENSKMYKLTKFLRRKR